MLSRMEEKYTLEIETVSKTRDAYRTTEYQATGLPIAPAVMLNNELLVQGAPISEEELELAICRHLANK